MRRSSRNRTRKKFFHLISVGLVFIGIASLLLHVSSEKACSASVTLAWDPNPEPEVTGYKVYNGVASRTYNGTVDIGNWTSCTISGLESGKTYYFAATAYGSAGQESAHSSEVVYTVPAACSYSLLPTSQSFGSSGGNGSISVTAQTACQWAASSSVTWIAITSGANGSGSGVLTYSVAANGTSNSRTGRITIGAQVVSISQSASGATYTITASAGLHGSISPSGQIAVSKGSSKTFVITPARGYKVARVRINGASIGAVTSYTFSNIKTNSTITAEFKR